MMLAQIKDVESILPGHESTPFEESDGRIFQGFLSPWRQIYKVTKQAVETPEEN